MNQTVLYLADALGRRTAVVLPICDYQKLLGDSGVLGVIAELEQDGILQHPVARLDQEGRSQSSESGPRPAAAVSWKVR